MKGITLLTLLVLSGSAEARIGETLDQCTYRYGASIGHLSRDQSGSIVATSILLCMCGAITRYAKILARKLAQRFQMTRSPRF
jgi:hypothetical protein